VLKCAELCIRSLSNERRLIVAGATGSGKTTQLPKIAHRTLAPQSRVGTQNTYFERFMQGNETRSLWSWWVPTDNTLPTGTWTVQLRINNVTVKTLTFTMT
jgi:hypothetical protein